MSFAFKVRKSLTNSSFTSIPSDAVEAYTVRRIKERLEAMHKKDPNIFDENDVKMFTEKGYIRRYMERQNGDEDKTTEMMIKVLKWRKCSGISTANDLSIPIEFYKVGALFIYNEDKNGNPLLYMRVKCHRKFPELKEPMKEFVTYMMFKVDALAADKGEQYGWSVVFDLTGVTMSQYDIPELVHIIQTFCEYFPAGLKRVFVNNLPWFLKPLVGVVMAFIPQEWKGVVRFINKSDIFKYIEKKNVPKFLGGTCEKSHREVPEGARSVKVIAVEQYEKYKVSEDRVEKLLAEYEKLFIED